MKIAIAVMTASFFSFPALAADAYGDPFHGSGFVSDDWHVVCDNTLTCRAAGYTDESAEWRGSILMTVAAGDKIPSTQVVLNYLESSDEIIAQIEGKNNSIELWLNDKFYGAIKPPVDGSSARGLTDAQTAQLIKQARKNSKVVFKKGAYQWQISDQGMAAVLLKLDDVQGRVGTSSALVSKTNPNRQIPKSAKAKPIIRKAFAYSDEDNKPLTPSTLSYFQENIDKWAIATLDNEARTDCNVLTSDQSWFDKNNKVWQFIAIDRNYTLARHPCWTGAYNFGHGYWLLDNDKPSKPELITLSGSEYSEGEIFSAHKGRGLGDCWSMSNWVWDGKSFVLSSELTTGMCRLIEASGAWSMPTYVSEVVEPNQ
ncbi:MULTISPECIES: DUF1176 domain-containing protein [unclassified Psychrobacter]|uniref:DUF1176 domain-containing protein n=2 Tax=Psychrobacter TaxID=497 RepID=UPI003F469C85